LWFSQYKPKNDIFIGFLISYCLIIQTTFLIEAIIKSTNFKIHVRNVTQKKKKVIIFLAVTKLLRSLDTKENLRMQTSWRGKKQLHILDLIFKLLTLLKKKSKKYKIQLTSLADSRNHCFADVALVIVSCVVNVLDAIINNTVSGLSFFKVSAR